MMKFNVNEIDSKHDFEIRGMSYIGNPKDGTCLFITGKIKRLVANLEGHKQCLVFIDMSVEVPDSIARDNCFIISENPAAEYGAFSLKMRQQELEASKDRHYSLMPGGYYLGENTVIGKNAVIEPECLIDHDVKIGDNAFIGFGSIIRNAVIGKSFSCYEHAVIGTESFNLGDADGYSYRIPSFGKVYIGDHVDIGANVVIERGFNSDTIIHNNVKIDSGVNIGHDVVLEVDSKISCDACLAGRVTVEKGAYIGMNATIRQRLTIGEKSTVAMGASVMNNVKSEVTMIGNPAKKLKL